MNTEKTVIRLWTHEINVDQLSAEELYKELRSTFDVIHVPERKCK